MYYRILVFLCGFGLMLIGLLYIIGYLNYLTIGYSLVDYFNFIIRRIECWCLLIGFILTCLALYFPDWSVKDDVSL